MEKEDAEITVEQFRKENCCYAVQVVSEYRLFVLDLNGPLSRVHCSELARRCVHQAKTVGVWQLRQAHESKTEDRASKSTSNVRSRRKPTKLSPRGQKKLRSHSRAAEITPKAGGADKTTRPQAEKTET
eukprot:2977929-Rhodomonas_salina.2